MLGASKRIRTGRAWKHSTKDVLNVNTTSPEHMVEQNVSRAIE